MPGKVRKNHGEGMVNYVGHEVKQNPMFLPPDLANNILVL